MMNQSRLPLLLMLSVLGSVRMASAQDLDKTMIAKVDSIFAKYNDMTAPGCALGIYRNGRLIYAKGYGSADLEHNVPISPNTVFDIGSTSKQFTATCLVLLQQQGKLSLDDDVRKYIPELSDYGHTITIRNLLNHTSGLRDYIGLMVMGSADIDDVTKPEDALRTIVHQKALNFEPGTEMAYSNTGYFLASVIVQRVSGKSLREFAHEQIFEPLGMTHTSYIDDHTEVVPNRAIGYSPGEDEAYHRDVSYWEQNGDGGVFTTVEDLIKWDQNFYEPRVGGRELGSELLRHGILKNGDTLDYAEGLYTGEFRGLKTVAHGGSWGGYRAQLIRIPSEHFSVAVLCNSGAMNPDRLAIGVVATVLADKLSAPVTKAPTATPSDVAQFDPASFDPGAFDDYVGNYEMEEQAGFVLSFSREGKTFYTQATGQGKIEIHPTSDSVFALQGVDASVTFHREPDGSVAQITLHQHGDHEAFRIDTSAPPSVDLTPYVGEYYSPELETAYTLTVEDGKLIATNPRLGDATLTPPRIATQSSFSGSSWNLEKVSFEKDTNGSVDAMIVSTGRIMGLRFERQK